MKYPKFETFYTRNIFLKNESIHAWIEAKDKFRENLTFRKKVLFYKKCSLMELVLKLVMTKKKKKTHMFCLVGREISS
jgi:hypothetical protein